MIKYFEWLMALRYLRARHREGFVSVIAWFSFLGILLGTATLIIVMSVMNGFDHDLTEHIVGLNGHVTISSYDGRLQDYTDVVAQLSHNPQVKLSFPIVERQVMVMRGERAVGAVVHGIRLADFMKRPLLMSKLMSDKLTDFSTGNNIIIGQQMADKFGLNVGDTLTILTPAGVTTPFGYAPQAGIFKIVGIFSSGMYIYDSSYIYMSLSAAQRFFNLPHSVTDIQIIGYNADQSSELAHVLHQTYPMYRIQDWQLNNAGFFSAVKTERNVMFLILLLIVIVAAFNIISGQVMLVSDKARSIAIFRTIGGSRFSVLKIFLMTGVLIGFTGTIVGGFLGVLIALNLNNIKVFIEKVFHVDVFNPTVYFLTQLPSRVSIVDVVFICGISFVLTFLASLYPAWRAARLQPAEVLRYE